MHDVSGAHILLYVVQGIVEEEDTLDVWCDGMIWWSHFVIALVESERMAKSSIMSAVCFLAIAAAAVVIDDDDGRLKQFRWRWRLEYSSSTVPLIFRRWR